MLGVVFHGAGIFFTLENTYDALIHLFFGNHYATHWFENWNYSWYTGFSVMGYPPLVHQAIGLLSFIGGLKFGLFTVAILAIILFITGVYRYALLLTGSRKVAGYAALIAVFSSSFVETLHIFGQLPSIVGVSVLMHAFPDIYLWVKNKKWISLFRAVSLIAVTVTSHHVTPIFGMVFFIFPLLGMAVLDVATDKVGNIKAVTIRVFIQSLFSRFKQIVLFGGFSMVTIVFCILPYWINSKQNPITQVPIPHGSRDNFLEITSSGLVFFLIPWGALLLILPYLFYRFFQKRYVFFGLSLSLLTLLGTGGTTPIPKKLLGDTAFNILTLDRFTLWASIMVLPMVGEFAYRFVEGDIKDIFQKKFSPIYHRLIGGGLVAVFIAFTIFSFTLGYFCPMQPQKINMLPISNFLSQDQHDHWRYLTLGFGDQMAWLSVQTNALTVDGNYHSARRLPELTTRAVERLENSKFRGIEGIGSLQQFLAVPEKYNLKYIFSNDKFYDPLLYFSGWHRLQMLENGIMVWEKLNVAPLSQILPRQDVSAPLKLMWGIIPLLTVVLAFVLNFQLAWYQVLKTKKSHPNTFDQYSNEERMLPKALLVLNHIWAFILAVILIISFYKNVLQDKSQSSVQSTLLAYYDALDFKQFKKAYTYLLSNGEKTLDQYMLEISVSDGILNSYAKVDDIQTTIIHQDKKKATARVQVNYVTPLNTIQKDFLHYLEKRGGKWFILPDDTPVDLPPNQFFTNNVTRFYNQGRRRITTQQTHHEDILKQPVLEVLSANLVKRGDQYHIVGEIQNVDNFPADVVIKATLFSKENVELSQYNASLYMKHKLLPKETTLFRIDFEGIAWLNVEEAKPKTFDPDTSTPVSFETPPAIFNLQCAGNVATKDLFKSVSITELELNPSSCSGVLYNQGTNEVTIPQLLVGYYTPDKTLSWVDMEFVREAVRVERKQRFNYKFIRTDSIQILNSSLENCYVNGLPNKEIAAKVVSERVVFGKLNKLPSGKGFVTFELNNFIGNP